MILVPMTKQVETQWRTPHRFDFYFCFIFANYFDSPLQIFLLVPFHYALVFLPTPSYAVQLMLQLSLGER